MQEMPKLSPATSRKVSYQLSPRLVKEFECSGHAQSASLSFELLLQIALYNNRYMSLKPYYLKNESKTILHQYQEGILIPRRDFPSCNFFSLKLT